MDFRATRTIPHESVARSSSNAFDHSTYVKVFSPINSVDFSSTSFAITSATRVQIFSGRTGKATKTISRFNDVARSASFRKDGKLLVTGDDSGVVQVFDAQSRTVLRQFKGHSLSVHRSRFTSTPTEVVSASDDRTVRLWDIPQESQTRVLNGHEDYVRSVVAAPDNASLLLSGSYDGTARLWDTRMAENEGCAITMKHGAPVEDVAFFSLSSSSSALSVGGPILRSWDLLMGGKCRSAVSNHSKTITSLATSNGRIWTAGLDQLVKVYDAANDFKVEHTMRYSAPILSCAISEDGQQLVTGMTDGTLCIQRRTTTRRFSTTASKASSPLNFGIDASNADKQTADQRVAAEGRSAGQRSTNAKLKSYDRLLKSFRYRDALDNVLRKNVRAEITFSVLDELRNRSVVNKQGLVVLDGLRRAIEGRDDVTLEPLLRFLLRHTSNVRYTPIICDTLDVIMDIYAPVLGQSPVVDELFGKLWTKVTDELNVQRQLVQVRGALEMILTRSALS